MLLGQHSKESSNMKQSIEVAIPFPFHWCPSVVALHVRYQTIAGAITTVGAQAAGVFQLRKSTLPISL